MSLDQRVKPGLADADSMLAAGPFYRGTTLQQGEFCPMMILYGIDLWSAIWPLLTPWWQQGAASLRRLFRKWGVSA
jgi:hypothetical protein